MDQQQNIYYLGRRSSDIATDFNANLSDAFFAGSITCYGDNRNGNIAYNVVSGIQLCDDNSIYGERNDTIYAKFFSEQCFQIAEKDPGALFLPYSIYFASMIPPELRHRAVCCNNEQVMLYLDNKINFRRWIQDLLPFPPYTIERGEEILRLIEEAIIPNEKEVVIQTEFGGGGEGTYFVIRETFSAEYASELKAAINPAVPYVVSEYVHNLCSIGVQIMVSDKEIGVYPPSIQLMNGPRYIGSDLYAFSLLDESIRNECLGIAITFGEILRDMTSMQIGNKTVSPVRNRGFFGLDLLIAQENRSPRVFVVETNPRFTGPVGLLNILCHKAGIGSVFEHNYDCFTGKRIEFDSFKKIKPNGRKRHAEITRDENGKAVSIESDNHNQEGLDQTVYQEADIYSHSVFEEIKTYNVYDDRRAFKEYLSKIADIR